jgi:hypothetical protein
MQPNEGVWDKMTDEEQALLASLPDGIIVAPPVQEGSKVRIFAWSPEKRHSASGEDRTDALRKLAKRLNDG